MKMFEKSHCLDNVFYEIRGPIMEEANRMISRGEKVLKLNIGNPAYFDFRVPQLLIDYMAKMLPESEAYSDSHGLASARAAIVEYCKEKKIPNVDMDDVYTGNGVSELISVAMQALLNTGDEMLVPSPDYPLWTAAVNMSGGKVVHYLCDEASDWYPDLKDLRSKVTDKTKGIVIVNPNNPTGAVYPDEVLQGIVDIAREYKLIIFADEIYDRLLMDGLSHSSIASLAPDLPVVTFNGLSKSHLAAGFRCGWMCFSGNKEMVRGYKDGVTLLASMRLCSNVPAQTIIPLALQNREETAKLYLPGGRAYEQRECVYKMLNDIPGITAVKPKAAFYIFPKIDVKRFKIHSDERFALDLLKQKKILITHGTGFNWIAPDHFRVVYLPEVDSLTTACTRMAEFFESYQQA